MVRHKSVDAQVGGLGLRLGGKVGVQRVDEGVQEFVGRVDDILGGRGHKRSGGRRVHRMRTRERLGQRALSPLCEGLDHLLDSLSHSLAREPVSVAQNDFVSARGDDVRSSAIQLRPSRHAVDRHDVARHQGPNDRCCFRGKVHYALPAAAKALYAVMRRYVAPIHFRHEVHVCEGGPIRNLVGRDAHSWWSVRIDLSGHALLAGCASHSLAAQGSPRWVPPRCAHPNVSRAEAPQYGFSLSPTKMGLPHPPLE
eukprot:scaffold4094_cov129-Isochrysis_galbana.AAC.2